MGINQRKTSTMVVKSIPPTPLDVSTIVSCKIDYLVVLLLLIPSLIYSRPNFPTSNSTYLQDILYKPAERMSKVTHHDIVTMAWTHFLVAVAGAFTPVLLLLCDDWISTLGLETLRSFHLSPNLDRVYETKAFFRVWIRKFYKCDSSNTSNSTQAQPRTSVKNTTHEYTFSSNIKQKSDPLYPKDFFDEFEDNIQIKNNYGPPKYNADSSKRFSNNLTKFAATKKTHFSTIRDIEDGVDTKNLSSARNLTYDDPIELKDDLHYL